MDASRGYLTLEKVTVERYNFRHVRQENVTIQPVSSDSQLPLLFAAYASESSLMAKRHMPDKPKHPPQASLFWMFVLIRRMAE